jgi:hypothetical protein
MMVGMFIDYVFLGVMSQFMVFHRGIKLMETLKSIKIKMLLGGLGK